MPASNSNGDRTRLLDASGRPLKFDYDAVEDRKRRRPPRIRLTSEDKHLPPAKRKKLVSTARDVARNFSIAAWALRKHADYVSTFQFQARSGNEALDTRLEELMKWWAKKGNFDVAGRHGLARFIRLAEIRRTLDGDFFPLKLSSGRVQGIEGDRIRTPAGGQLPDGVDPEDVVHGVVVSKTGRAKTYCLADRNKMGDGFKFARLVPARHLLAHGYYDRIDQVRGVSLVASGINLLQDVYESLEYGVAKAKIAQLFGIKITREGEEEESLGDVTTSTDGEGEPDKSETEIDFGRGPFQLDLSTGEDADVLESKTAPAEFQEFMKLLIQIALKAVDIPYGFFDESFTNYAGNRQAWLLYDQSAEIKRDDNRELLDALTAWRIMLWIVDGELVLPKSASVESLSWEWISRGIPWIDPLKEIKADGEAIDRKLTSRTRVLKRQGLDFREIADELAMEEEYLRSKGLLGTVPKMAARSDEPVDQWYWRPLAQHLAELIANPN